MLGRISFITEQRKPQGVRTTGQILTNLPFLGDFFKEDLQLYCFYGLEWTIFLHLSIIRELMTYNGSQMGLDHIRV